MMLKQGFFYSRMHFLIYLKPKRNAKNLLPFGPESPAGRLALWQAKDPDVLGRRSHDVDISLCLTSL